MSFRRLLLVVLAPCVAWGCGGDERTVLNVYHAGSLAVPLAGFERAFEAAHPGIDVRCHAYGSAMAIRQVTELGKAADVVASADFQLIDKMMIEARPQWASWNLLFARNAMVLAVREGLDVDGSSWLDVLDDDRLTVGLSNPNHDPCGYRALMSLVLAERHLGHEGEGLFKRLVEDNSRVRVKRFADSVEIAVPGDGAFSGRLVVRPKETDLVALLETGSLDCLLIYRSVATQHGLRFLPLPGETNLGEMAHEENYARVRLRQFSDRPEAVTITGSAIVYGVTIPQNAPNDALAQAFVRFFVSREGRRILTDAGQQPLSPVRYSPSSAGAEINKVKGS